jgi:hypothetical protein
VDTQRRKQSELIEHGGCTGARVYGVCGVPRRWSVSVRRVDD